MNEEELKNKIIEKEVKKTLIKKIKSHLMPFLYWTCLALLSGLLTYAFLK